MSARSRARYEVNRRKRRRIRKARRLNRDRQAEYPADRNR